MQGAGGGGWSSVWAASRQSLLPRGIVVVDLQPPLQSLSPHRTLAAGTLVALCRCLPVGVIPGWLSPGKAGGKHLPGGAWLPVPSAEPAALALPASQEHPHPHPTPRRLGPPAAPAGVCLSPCTHASPGYSHPVGRQPDGRGPEKWPWGLPVPKGPGLLIGKRSGGWADERGLLGTGSDTGEDTGGRVSKPFTKTRSPTGCGGGQGPGPTRRVWGL